MAFLPSVGGFNPNMSLINPQDVQGLLGGALSPEMQQQMMPMGMMNRDGQSFMGQGGDSNVGTENNPVNNAIYQMMAKGLQGLGNKAQQAINPNTAQIIRDTNQFRFAGNPQQQMANALRNRG